MKNVPEISIVIPAKNEQESLPILYREIVNVLEKTDQTFEIIIVDDGSTDDTPICINSIVLKDKRVRAVILRGNWGKSTALQAGLDASSGNIIITMDADLQDNPKDIPNFIKKINQGYDLVVGWKKKRQDSFKIIIPSKILNNVLIPLLTGVKLHDNNCGFKAFKRRVLKDLYLYGELYRFIPVLVAKENYSICEIEVTHRKRRYGQSKYNWQKNVKGFLDLITIVFLTGYIRRPGHFFGTAGLISFFFGFLIGCYITYLRITTGSIQYRQPLLILGILLMLIGIQLITTGLLAEMLTYHNRKNISSKKFIDKYIN